MLHRATRCIKPALLLAPHCSPFLRRESCCFFCRRLFLGRYVVLAVRPPVIFGLGPVHLVHLSARSLVWRHLLTDQSSVLREALNFCSSRARWSTCRRQYCVPVLDAFTPRQSRVLQPDTPGGKFPGSLRFTSRKHLREELTESVRVGKQTLEGAWNEVLIASDGRCRFTRAGQSSTAVLTNWTKVCRK